MASSGVQKDPFPTVIQHDIHAGRELAQAFPASWMLPDIAGLV
jgi:hypothetical protein